MGKTIRLLKLELSLIFDSEESKVTNLILQNFNACKQNI